MIRNVKTLILYSLFICFFHLVYNSLKNSLSSFLIFEHSFGFGTFSFIITRGISNRFILNQKVFTSMQHPISSSLLQSLSESLLSPSL